MNTRALIFLTLAGGLAGCGSDEQANNTVNIDQAVMSEELTANDVTAIDAVTGDAANMAADVDINFTNDMLGGAVGNEAGPAPASRPRSPTRKAEPVSRPEPVPAAEPEANAATNATE